MSTPLRRASVIAFALLLLLAPAIGQDEPFSDAPDPNPVDTKRRWRMERTDVLKKVDLKEVQAEGNFVFYIQQAFGQSENYNERTVKMHLPWLQAAEKLFDEMVRNPAGLSKGTSREPIAIIVMNTTGDINNYLSRREVRCAFHSESGYDEGLAAVLTYSLTAPATATREERGRDLVHATVHALWQAHTHTLDSLVGPYWLREGVADHISQSFGKSASVTNSRIDHDAQAVYITKALTLNGFKNENLSTLDDLIRETPRILEDKALATRLQAVQKDQVPRYWACHSMQGTALFDFMLNGANGIHRDALNRYLALVLAGKTGPNVFREGMGTFVLSDLEIGYWQSIMETAKRVDKTIDLNAVRGHARVVQAAANLGATIKEEAPRVATGAKPAAPKPTAGNTPGIAAPVAIAPPKWTPTDLTSLALHLAKTGDFRGALRVVDELKESMVGGVVSDDIERLRTRLTKTLELRDACLASAIASGTRFKILVDGKTANVVATGFTEDAIELVKGKKNPKLVPISALDSSEIARMARKAEPALGTPELRGFLEALAETKRWTRTLKADLGAGSLLDDLTDEFKQLAGHAEYGSVVATLQSLTPLDRDNAAVQVAQVVALLELAADHELVKANNFFLASVARELFVESFTDKDISRLLQASDVTITGDLLSMTYDFNAPSQLADFPSSPTTGSTNFFQWSESGLQPKDWSVRITSGALRVRGESMLRHIIPLSTPVHVTYEASDIEIPVQVESPVANFGVSVCDDQGQSFVYCGVHADYLYISDKGKQTVFRDENLRTAFVNRVHTVDIVVDAKQVVIQQDDDEPLTGPISGPRQGHTHLFIRTDRELVVDKITIEGTLTDEIRAQIAQLHADSELRKLGLL